MVPTVQAVTRRRARYDGIPQFYDRLVGEDVTDPATAALLELLPDCAGLRLLELACGQGRVARELARRGGAVVAVDVSGQLLQRARVIDRDFPLAIEYVHADAARPNELPGRSFDGVVCNFGLSDIDDLDGALSTVGRVLVPDGWFVFSILHPCFPGWDADAPSSWPATGGYYAEGWWLAQNSGIRGQVGANHRMLSTYLNGLRRHGLIVEVAVEPVPGDDWVARAPNRTPVPVYLVARCRMSPVEGPRLADEISAQ